MRAPSSAGVKVPQPMPLEPGHGVLPTISMSGSCPAQRICRSAPCKVCLCLARWYAQAPGRGASKKCWTSEQYLEQKVALPPPPSKPVQLGGSGSSMQCGWPAPTSAMMPVMLSQVLISAAGLIDLVRKGHFADGSNVLFVHTGGAPTLYHYKPLPAGSTVWQGAASRL